MGGNGERDARRWIAMNKSRLNILLCLHLAVAAVIYALVFNSGPSTGALAAGSRRDTTEGRRSFRRPGYGRQRVGVVLGLVPR